MSTIKKSLVETMLTVGLLIWMVALAIIKGPALLSAYSSNHAPRIADWKKLYDDRTPILGSSSAEFKIIEFSDYQCPYCGLEDPDLAKFAALHPNDVAVYRIDMPLRKIHRNAYKASIAANCAEDQGVREPYQSLLFAHQKDLSSLDYRDLAMQVNIKSVTNFTHCMDDESPKDKIAKDVAMAESIGVMSTPTMVINGRLYRKAMPAGQFEERYSDFQKQKHNPFRWLVARFGA